MNVVTLSGRLGRDPEIKTTPSGSKVVSFSLGVDRRGKNGEKEVDWVDCTAWGKTGETVENYCNKGTAIEVVGKIQTRSYQGNDGKNHKVVFVLVDNIFFQKGNAQPAQAQAVTSSTELPPAPTQPTRPSGDQLEMPFEL